MELQDKIDQLFGTHPTVNTFFMTSDEEFFHTRGNADAHAMRLKDRGVAQIERQTAVTPKTAVPAGDPLLAHPEFNPASPEEIAAKAKADDDAQEALNAKLKIVGKKEKPGAAVIDTTDADKAAADKKAADLAAEEKLLADKAAADKAAEDSAAIEKAAADKANTEKANEKALADKAALDKAAVDKAAAEKAATDKNAN